MNLFKRIIKFFKDIDNAIIDDALDECDYIAAIIVGKQNKLKNNE